MKRIVCGVISLCLLSPTFVCAQSPSIEELKVRIFDARALQQTFAKGLKFCNVFERHQFLFRAA